MSKVIASKESRIAIYCQENYDERVNINRVREWCARIRNEARKGGQAEHVDSEREWVRDYSAVKIYQDVAESSCMTWALHRQGPEEKRCK